jgi:hypothetical protein
MLIFLHQLHVYVGALGEAGRQIIDRLTSFFRLITVCFIAYLALFTLGIIQCVRLFIGLHTAVYFARLRPEIDLFSPGKAVILAAALAFLLRATVCTKSGAEQGSSGTVAATMAGDADADRLLRAPLAQHVEVELDS